MGFMHDQLADGRGIRLFDVIDDLNREPLAIEIDFSRPAERVIRVLDQIIEWSGKPDVIRCDNGPEYVSGLNLNWAKNVESELSSFSLDSLTRMPTLNATTEPCVTIGEHAIYSIRSKRFKNSPLNGFGQMIINGPTWP
jgi:transposase InsO family protein